MNILEQGIILSTEHWGQMVSDVSSRSHEEACGLIGGIENRAKVVIPITNLLHDPHRFRMDPKEELDAFLLTERMSCDIIAIYHSHPYGIRVPSPTDYAELSFPGIIYLIWFTEANVWQCRGYLMYSQSRAEQVPVITSTNE
jgi:[CysO sulfur-carrier protein]-S-L-cysteine hydrolase